MPKDSQKFPHGHKNHKCAKDCPNFKKPKQWYQIMVEGEVPIVVYYRVFAEDEDAAFDILERQPHMLQLDSHPKPELRRVKKRKVSIKNLLTGWINWVRTF